MDNRGTYCFQGHHKIEIELIDIAAVHLSEEISVRLNAYIIS